MHNKIPTEKLGADVERVTDELGKPPSFHEYRERGEYDSATIANRFGDGSWIAALNELGYEYDAEVSGGPENVSLDDLQTAVEQVVEDLGRTPTKAEFNNHSAHSPATVAQRFGDGSWVDALDALGYDHTVRKPGGATKIPADELRADVTRVADELGHSPTIGDYNDHGEYAANTIAQRLGDGSWHAVLESLGLPIPDRGGSKKIPRDDLESDVERVIELLGHVPSKSEYDEHGEYSISTLANRFGEGSWTAALNEFGYPTPSHQRTPAIPRSKLQRDMEQIVADLGRPPTIDEYDAYSTYSLDAIENGINASAWSDVLSELGVEGADAADSTAEAIRADVEAVARDLGQPPSPQIYDEEGEYSALIVALRFGNGSWLLALDALGYEVTAA